jgi:ABC-2 type transport system permease protein
MLEIARFEAGGRGRSSALLSLLMAALVGLIVGIYPSIDEAGVDYEAYVEALPPEVANAFGTTVGLGTIEGFLVAELYGVVWVLVLGGYVAYAAGGLLAGEVADGSMALVLVGPVSRSRIVVGKFVGLLPTVVFVDAVGLLAVVAAAGLIDVSVAVGPLVVLHALFVLFHAACAGVGLVVSAAVTSRRRAGAVAATLLLVTYLVETVTLDTDWEAIGLLSLSRHFDPGEVLVEETVAPGDVGLLVAVTVALVVLAAETFERRDVG